MGPGSIIAGRYQILARLGQGGMGSVWSAEHLSLRSPVAIKLIDPTIADRPESLVRFQAEAQAAAALRSAHVVQILDYGVDDGVPYIAMEMLDGESLADRLKRIGRLPHADVARIVTHVARALARAQEVGIVHRDLKPENVFLVKNDDHDLAKVLDFGIAKTDASRLPSAKGPTRTGSIIGTPKYMSPEQAQGMKTIDGRSDLWSLAVIAFECIVGQPPFESEALGDLLMQICARPLPVPSGIAAVPAGFDAWFARACERDVAARFQTAKELSESLRAILLRDGDPRGSGASLPPSSGSATVAQATEPGEPLPSMAVRVEAPTSLATEVPSSPRSPSMSESGSIVEPRRPTGALVAVGLGVAFSAAIAVWIMLGRGEASRAMPVVRPVTSASIDHAASSRPTVAPAPAASAAHVDAEAEHRAALPSDAPEGTPPSVVPAPPLSTPAEVHPTKARTASRPPPPPRPATAPPPTPTPAPPSGDQRLGF